MIKETVDFYFQTFKELGGMFTDASFIPAEMVDEFCTSPFEETLCWKPIPSTVTMIDLREIEDLLGIPLPPSYKLFLQYKHFVEFSLPAISFPTFTPQDWKQALREQFYRYPVEYTLHKGYIPFANYSDYGIICFNTNQRKLQNEYTIVWLDHEQLDHAWELAEDFTDFFKDIRKQIEKWRIEYLK